MHFATNIWFKKGYNNDIRTKVISEWDRFNPQRLRFTLRFPGHKKQLIPRVGLSSLGPFHEICADEHEKLSAQASQMGELSLPMYGYKDKYTDFLETLKLLPNSRTAGAGGHIFLDFVEETGCIPIQLTTDKGSKIGWQYAFQSILREYFAPNIDPAIFAAYMVLKSVHNTVIEGFWRWLKTKMEAIAELREYLTEEVGSRETHLGWPGVTPEFKAIVGGACAGIGSPEMTMESAWNIFAQMSAVLENY
ncbi:hypothetical protein DFH09DRAFT_1071261 [Mycena vulgaris]|nr:hypothetical protein DFH09DRAFT_1071261 [Mycena vulgaris]